LNKYKYSVRSNEEGFDENTVHLCANSKGESFIMDPGNDEPKKPFFVLVFTTDELVCNLALQEQSGQDIHVMMDASYHVSNVRKCGYIPMKVANLTQTGLTVAYAMTTKEDKEAHAFLTNAGVTTVENVVNKKKAHGGSFF
jgi:hypothetical protein